MYTPHVEELEARNLLNSSFSPHLFAVYRSDAPRTSNEPVFAAPAASTVSPAPGSGTHFDQMLVNGKPAMPATEPAFANEYSVQSRSAGGTLPPPLNGPLMISGPLVVERTFSPADHPGETIEILIPEGVPAFQGNVEFHSHTPPFDYAASVIAPVAAVAASEGSGLTLDPAAARSNVSSPTAVQPLPDFSHVSNIAGVDPSSNSAALRLAVVPAPRLDTLVGLAVFRVEAQTNAAIHNPNATGLRDAEIAAATPDTPLPATLRQAPATDSASEDTVPPSPVTQQGSALSVLPALNVTALEQAMKHFLRHLQTTGDDLTAKYEKAGLGVWLVAGTAAAAACEIARRQLRTSRGKLAVEWNWIAGVPPEPPFGQ
jgi:hypothetical protein